jgi:hypothetical protein
MPPEQRLQPSPSYSDEETEHSSYSTMGATTTTMHRVVSRGEISLAENDTASSRVEDYKVRKSSLIG